MKRFIIHYLVIITTLTSLLVCVFPQHEIASGYEMLWLQPLVFLVVYLMIFIPLIKKGQYKITTYSLIALAWLRCVLIPLGSSLTGVYNGVSYISVGEDSTQLAILLVVLELFVTSAFLFLMINTKTRKSRKLEPRYFNDDLVLVGNKNVYVAFIILAIVLYVAVGRNLNLLQFFVISVDSSERYRDLDSTRLVLLRQIFSCAFIFLFVWYTSYCKKRYEVTGKNKYVNFAIIVAMLNVGVIVGERRTAQVYTCLIVIFILIHAFKNHKKKIILIITSTAIGILLFMSIYKHFAAFAYGSYYEAFRASDINLEWLTVTLQSYFFGTQNVAVTIELGKYANLDIVNMLYDFGRSIFGLSFLLKGDMAMTSEIFNTFIYGQVTPTGHVLSGLGYGYIYLGTVFSPMIVCLNIYISIKLEKWFYKTNSYEMKYIVGYMLVRFATNIYVNTPPLISLATIMLFTAGLIYFVAKILKTS